MSRGFKIMSSILAVVVIALVGFLVYVYSSLGSILKDAVEEYGPRYTGVSVTLEKVELAPESGQAELSGLVIGNPQGYQTDAAFKLDRISINIDLRSITKETIVIKSIIIDEPRVTYEFGNNGSNVDRIGTNVEKAAAESGSGEPKQDDGSGKKMVVESLVINSGKVAVNHPLLKDKKLASDLPTIRLNDIGKNKKDGATPAEVVDKIMDAIEKQVSIAVGATGRLRKLFDK